MNFLIARAGKHYWEEPVISGAEGSGTIFFSGCNLRCVFCQNYQISRGKKGLNVSREQLVYLMQSLEKQGARNINLVTPSHYARPLVSVLEKAKSKINIPIVYNSSGYDREEDLKRLKGLVDIYLPDMKYYSSFLSEKYSGKGDYFEIASKAIMEMRSQQPYDIFEDGIMKKGMIVRHLILPSNVDDSEQILNFLARFNKNLYISLMSQYFPSGDLSQFGELNRRLYQSEYQRVCDYFFEVGLVNGFMQDLDSAIEDYVPDFDLEELKGQISLAERLYGE